MYLLSTNGRTFEIRMHILVAIMFLSEDMSRTVRRLGERGDHCPEVHHRNAARCDNHFWNLVWVSKWQKNRFRCKDLNYDEIHSDTEED